MSDLKIQGEVVMDASGATAALDKVGASAGDMANKVTQAAGKAGEAVDGIGTGAEAGAEKFTRAESRMRDAIKKSTEQLQLLGKTASQQLEFKIETKGLDAQKFQPYLDELKRLESAQKSVGVSAAQTAAAMRGVPAQFSDIVASLQGGQAPLTVFLQQGGQLKDMFGGAGAAAKALGGYVVGLVNPFTVAAAAGAVLALAYMQGSKEAEAYSRAIIMTGNAAGVTVGQLQAQAQAISAVSGVTQAAAAEALAQVVGSGKVSADNLGIVTEAALKLEKVGGQSVAKTVDQFADLAKSPVEASKKLNEEYGYLTTAVFRQVKALEDQGRASEAAEVAQRALGEALSSRASQITQNLGVLETAWKGVTDRAKAAWDAMLGVGRAESNEQKLASYKEQIAQIENELARAVEIGKTQGGSAYVEQLKTALSYAQAQAAAIGGVVSAQQASTKATAEQSEAQKAGIAWIDEGNKYRSKSQQLESELLKLRNQAAAALKDETLSAKQQSDIRVQLAEREKFVRDKFAEKAAGKEANPFASSQEAAKAWATYIQEFAKAATNAEAKTDDLTDSQKRLLEMLKRPDFQNWPEVMQQSALQQAYAAIAAEQHGAAEKVLAIQAKEAAKALVDSYEAIEKRTEALGSEAEKQREATEAIGMSTLAVASLEAARLEEQAAAKIRRANLADDIDFSGKLGDAYRAEAAALRELAQAKMGRATAQNMADVAKAAADEWKRTAENINRSITDSLMRGFESGKGFAQSLRDTVVNMFKTLVLRPIISFIVNPVAAAITGSLGLSGAASAATTASSGANLFSGGGSGLITSGAAGLYSTGAQVYSMGLETLGNSMMSLGNWAASNASALQTFGNGLGYASAAISAFKGNWGAAAGTAIGTYFGGPIGATIGNYLGSLIDSAFAGESRSGGQYGVAYDGKVTNNRRGETYGYVGQQYNRDNSTGVRVTNGQSYLMEADGLGATADAAINKAVAGAASAIDKTLAALGSKMQTTGYWAGLETSGKGRGGVFAGGSLTGGVGFGESGKGDNYAGTLYEKWSTQSPDAATAMTNFTLDLKQSVVQALQAAGDIPETIKTMLEDDTGKLLEVETMTAEQVDALLAAIDNQIVAVQTLNTVADMLPLENLKKLSFDASSELIKLAGSLDTLTSQAQTYYQTYYSTEEQTTNTLKNIRTSLEAVGLELPTTRDGFRSLVEAQDLNTESGRKAYVALMAVSSAFAEVTTASETAAEAAKKEAETKAQAEKDAAQAAKDKAISAANSAYTALSNAVSAQKTILQEVVTSAQAAVSTIGGIFDTLKTNVDELYNSVATTQVQSQSQALQFIDSALAAAQATGTLPDGTALSDAISAARTGLSDTSGYSSLFEQQRAQLILAGKLSQLQDIAGVQKSLAQQQLDAANEQIDQLDKTLAYWKTQTEIATGTYEATLSVADAITALTEALTGATAATTTKPGVVQTGASPEFTVGGGGAGAGTTFNTADSSDAKSLREVYKSSYGWSDADFASWYSNPLNTANAEEEARRRGIPLLSTGTNYVARGGLAWLHEKEAVVPAVYNPAANGVLQSDGQTAKLLTQLIQEVQAMRQSTERTASAVEGNQSVPLLVEIAS